MNMAFLELDEVEGKEVFPGGKGQFIHTDNMTFAYWDFEAGAKVPEHSHPHEQVVNMIESELELTIDGSSKRLKPGLVAIVPPKAKHSGTAITDCRIVDVFCPVREDYR
jgi:quercetin dioxygenase-like cupin family protein